jgi:hypothetical protein
VQAALLLAIPLVLFLRRDVQAQLFIPLDFQRVSHQAIVRIHPHIAQLRPLGLILSSLHLLLSQPLRFGQAPLDFALHIQGDFQRQRCDARN